MKILAIIIVALLAIGCASTPVPSPHTVFSPPTTAPSAAPSIKSASDANAIAQQRSIEAHDRAAGLTAENLPQEKPAFLDFLGSLTDAIVATGNRLAEAAEKSRASDQAIKQIAKERDDAREIVRQREKTIGDRDTEIAKLKSEEEAMNVRWASIAIGFFIAVLVYEQGLGFAAGGIVGVLAFMFTPVVYHAGEPIVKYGVPALFVCGVIYLIEVKGKGGFLAAIHDNFSKPKV